MYRPHILNISEPGPKGEIAARTYGIQLAVGRINFA
jgi:hypothetical protein